MKDVLDEWLIITLIGIQPKKEVEADYIVSSPQMAGCGNGCYGSCKTSCFRGCKQNCPSGCHVGCKGGCKGHSR